MVRLTEEQVVTVNKAIRQIVDFLAIDELLIAQLLGFEDEEIIEYLSGERQIEANSESMIIRAIELIEVYTLMETMFGESDRSVRWLNSENSTLGTRPVELISTPKGLNQLLMHLRESVHGRA
jgi:uncharacterized protein (DUF2384 family)